MKVQFSLLALALASGLISAACSPTSGGPTGTAGTSSSSGGTTGTGGTMGATCPNVTACGGDVVGTWSVSSPCLKLNGSDIDFSLAGLDPNHSDNVGVTGSLSVSGTWTANADGTYTDGTTTTGTTTTRVGG